MLSIGNQMYIASIVGLLTSAASYMKETDAWLAITCLLVSAVAIVGGICLQHRGLSVIELVELKHKCDKCSEKKSQN